ncbi:Phage protein [Pseudomonas sp. IT-P294]
MPLIYSISEAEILEWDAGKALRRYDIAITRLGVKKE